MSTGSTATGWHALRGETQAGPYTWIELYGLAQSGQVAPEDLVWHESLTGWIAAATVPNLFPAGPVTGSSPATSPGPPTRRRAGWLIPVVAVVAVMVVLGGIAGALLLARGGGDDSADSGNGSTVGVSSFTPPTPADLVETQAWGRVPINQIGVVLLDGKDRGDADKLAEDLGGTVVGQMDFINLYQLQVPATSEAELSALIDKATATEGVESAFPNQETLLDEEIWGVRSTPLDDPVYEGQNGKGYAMIGVQRAWDLIRGSGRDLTAVQVGVVDNGLYKGQGEFDGESSVAGGEPGDELAAPTKDDEGNDDLYGSHGTAVAGIIGADSDNGGQSGVASVLGDKLKIMSTNIWGPKYGVNTPAAPDPNDPTQHTFTDGTFSLGGLQALKYQVDQGSKVINCSWGNSDAHPSVAATYKKFFEKMAADHPDVIFVCSAGNDGKALDGKKRYPSGLNLPNMITVGNLDNDGSKWKSSNAIGTDFEVTLGAPGHRAVSGVDPLTGEVSNEYGGTSFATPQVTATAAMLKSLNPKLTAVQIKDILTQTAAPGVTDDEKQQSIPFPKDELGAGVLRTDLAVAKVLYDLKNPSAAGTPTDSATLEKFVDDEQKRGVIDAVAVTTDDPETYDVRGIVEAVGNAGADVTVALSGQGAIGGDTSQHLDAPGEPAWSITALDQISTITVRRTDSGASSVIRIERIDLNGHWAGTFTFTSITIDEAAKASLEESGCDLSQLESLAGTSMPMTLDITADVGGGGSAVLFIDVASISEDATSEPTSGTLQWGGNQFTVAISGQWGGTLKGKASRDGDVETLTGTLTSVGGGFTSTGTWTATR